MVMALVMPDPLAPSFTALINVVLRNGSANGRCEMGTGITIGFVVLFRRPPPCRHFLQSRCRKALIAEYPCVKGVAHKVVRQIPKELKSV